MKKKRLDLSGNDLLASSNTTFDFHLRRLPLARRSHLTTVSLVNLSRRTEERREAKNKWGIRWCASTTVAKTQCAGRFTTMHIAQGLIDTDHPRLSANSETVLRLLLSIRKVSDKWRSGAGAGR